MKKVLMLITMSLVLALTACTPKRDPFEIRSITVDKIEEKMEQKDSFIFVVVRENCPYCKKVEEYIEETKSQHPGVVLYQLDTTDFEIYKEKEDDDYLRAKTEEGTRFLEMAPTFMYTPTFYAVVDGTIQSSGVGFDPETKKVNLWEKLEQPIDFDKAESEDVWDYIEANG